MEAALKYKHDTPKISAIFEIFDPKAVPRAIASLPFSIEEMLTKTSGAEVPAAIRVSPITKSLTPKCFAITDA